MTKDVVKNIVHEKWFQGLMYSLAILTAVIPIIGSLLKSGIDCDSAYYISIAERVVDGYKPYSYLHYGYTPLFIYMMAGMKWLFHIPAGMYWPYLLLHYVLQIGVAGFIYGIAKRMGAGKNVALLGAWLYVMMSHWLQGNAVLLEVPSVFFGMLSILLLLAYQNRNITHYIWIGAISACSFLCKQYGLGFLVLDLYLMLFVTRKGWKESCSFVIGYLIPIAMCLIYWGGDFFQGVINNGYGTTSAADAGYDVSLGSKIGSIVGNLWYFCYMVCPMVLMVVLCGYQAYKQNHLAKLLVGVFGLLGFSMEFYFSGGGLHYLQYHVPFAILIIMELLTIKDIKLLQYLKYVMLLLVVSITVYKTYNNRVYKLYIKADQRAKQYSFTEKVREYVKPGETIWVVHGGEYYLYFTLDNLPPNMETISYSFGPLGLNESKAFEQAKNTDWVIRYSEDYPYESFFTDSLKHYVEQYPTIVLQDSAVLLHKMR